MPFALILIVVVVLAFIAPVLPLEGTISQYVIGAIQKGFRVGDASTWNPSAPSEIAESPDDLAASANLDLETYTLARVISSEEGNQGTSYWLAIACATRNNGGPGGIFAYATDGSYGKQGRARPVSTGQDPYEGHVTIAQLVLAGAADITQGATMWVAPRAQEALHARDPATYKSFAEVNASRIASGKRPVNVDGVNSSLLQFYA